MAGANPMAMMMQQMMSNPAQLAMMQQLMSNPAQMQQMMAAAQQIRQMTGAGAAGGLAGMPALGLGMPFPTATPSLPTSAPVADAAAAGEAAAVASPQPGEPAAAPGTQVANNPLAAALQRTRFASQLQQLVAMGFTNESVCLQALAQHNGRLDAAIDTLLASNGGDIPPPAPPEG